MGLSKEKALEIITTLPDDGELILRTPQEEEEFLKNYEATKISEKIDGRISEVHSRYDSDWYEVTGERKDGTQKTYHFIKERAKEMKKALDELPRLKEKIKDYESKGGEASKKEIESLRKQMDDITNVHKQKEQEWQTAIQQANNVAEEQVLHSLLDAELRDVKWKKEIPESVRNDYIKAKQRELIKNRDKVENEWAFRKNDKEYYRNPSTLAVLSPREIQLQLFADLIDQTKKQEGSGRTPEGVAEGEPVFEALPGEVDSKDKLSEWLMKVKGFARGTDEYTKWYNELSPKLTKLI